MRFKTKDLVVTVLPRRIVIEEAEEAGNEENRIPEPHTCPCNTARGTLITPLVDRSEDNDGPVTILGRHLEALQVYQKAFTEDYDKSDKDRTLDWIKRDEKRLLKALEGVRQARQKLEQAAPSEEEPSKEHA